MTDPTEQETELYNAMTAGDWDVIDDAREAAYNDEDPDVGTQFDEDYANAHAHYQGDHEAPQDEREQATAEQVDDENDVAERAADDDV